MGTPYSCLYASSIYIIQGWLELHHTWFAGFHPSMSSGSSNSAALCMQPKIRHAQTFYLTRWLWMFALFAFIFVWFHKLTLSLYYILLCTSVWLFPVLFSVYSWVFLCYYVWSLTFSFLCQSKCFEKPSVLHFALYIHVIVSIFVYRCFSHASTCKSLLYLSEWFLALCTFYLSFLLPFHVLVSCDFLFSLLFLALKLAFLVAMFVLFPLPLR